MSVHFLGSHRLDGRHGGPARRGARPPGPRLVRQHVHGDGHAHRRMADNRARHINIYRPLSYPRPLSAIGASLGAWTRNGLFRRALTGESAPKRPRCARRLYNCGWFGFWLDLNVFCCSKGLYEWCVIGLCWIGDLIFGNGWISCCYLEIIKINELCDSCW